MLVIDPPIPYVLPAQPLQIALVGCGGTGSYIALALARIAYHLQQQSAPPLDITFIDGDVVEKGNVGRQWFSDAELGQFKACSLAARLNAALGLRIRAIPEMASGHLLGQLPRSVPGILIGAVDTASGRRTLATALHDAYSPWRLWLDCGNHEASGQVALGTVTEAPDLLEALALGAVCTALPAASLLYPAILAETPKPRTPLDCARAMADGAQSLTVNSMMAAIAGEYLHQLLVRHQVATFQTVVDLGSLSMRSSPITAAALAQATGLPSSHFAAKAAPQKGPENDLPRQRRPRRATTAAV